MLGLPVVERWPEREAIWVMAGERTRIGLWRPQVGLQGGRGGIHVHFAMHIAADRYDAAAAHLRAQGQDVREEVFGPDHGRALYVDDPDGNVVELWTWDVAQPSRRLAVASYFRRIVTIFAARLRAWSVTVTRSRMRWPLRRCAR